MAQRGNNGYPPVDPGTDVAFIHFEALKQYAASYLQSQANSRQSSQRASAREKLTRLTRQQFEELCTNVFDEMRRRQYNSHDVPFLPVNNEYHPKRNQARQKLATLHMTRFKDLAVDVYLEIERRFPYVTALFQQRWGPEPLRGTETMTSPPPMPMPSLPQQTSPTPRIDKDRSVASPLSPNHVPNADLRASPEASKSFEPTVRDPPSPKTANLDNLLDDLNDVNFDDDEKEKIISQLEFKLANAERKITDFEKIKKENENLIVNLKKLDGENKKLMDGFAKERQEMNNQSSNFEKRIAQQQDQIIQLERNLSSLQQESSSQIQDLEAKYANEQQRNAKIQNQIEQIELDYDKLKSEFDSLEQDYKGLQEDYNSQQQMIGEIRNEATNILEEHKLLEKTNEELKAERERNLQQIRELIDMKDSNSVRDTHSSSGSQLQRSRSLGEKIEFENERIIGPSRMNSYNNAVEDLLRAARSDAPTSVLVAMKAIVLSCKEITESTERFESNLRLRQETRERLNIIKNRLSQGLAGLMSSAKLHATSPHGTTPIVQLENNAKNLTNTINELLQVLRKVERDGNRSQERGERADEQRDRERVLNENYPGNEEINVDELRLFLEQQTDLMVQGIQSVLMLMKQTSNLGPDFGRTVRNITEIVNNVVQVSRRVLQRSNKRNQAEDILLDLERSNVRLGDLGEEMSKYTAAKQDKQRLATSSSEIAKRVKELVSLLE
ncbi:component of the polarisome [Nowakowskiella sp. JEL0078]|nr:component of the polarisome [Nowakowskiella sp. JEL0078]